MYVIWSQLLPLSNVLLSFMVHLLTLYFPFYHMTPGFSLEIKTKKPKSLLNTGRFILNCVIDSSTKYNIIAKEEKDPKDPYAINTCSTKLLSSKLNLYMHRNCTNPYRKALVIKLDALLNYLKISNNVISCPTQSKCN